MLKRALLFSCLSLLFVSGCTQNKQSQNPDYDETKKMVVDILKTDDGKETIKEILGDDKVKEAIIMNPDEVKDTIQSTLTSQQGTDFWKKVFEDPTFAEGFAHSLQNEHTKVLKQLMNDPEYQKMFMSILQDPEMQKKYIEAMKSQDFRSSLEQVITETLSSPLYKKQFEEAMKKSASQSSEGSSSEGESEDKGKSK